VGSGPTSLMDSFEKHVGGTPDEGSADTVSAAWVDMVAALEEARMDSVLRAWACRPSGAQRARQRTDQRYADGAPQT
jgi:hypothetical protein